MTSDRAWLRYDTASRRISLSVRVQPNARRSEIVGQHGTALKVRIAAPAVDSKANSALVDYLSESLGIARSAVVIRRGAASRQKVVEITGGPELVLLLRSLAGN